jgi:hypothetical protein
MLLPIQLVPFARLAKRLISGRRSLESVAYQVDVLCPQETVTISPAIFLPGQLERVTERLQDPWVPDTNSEAEIAAAVATRISYAPTIAYHIKNAVLFDGSIYAKDYRYPLHPVGDKSVFASTDKRLRHLNIAALASSFLGTRYFFHWLADDCSKYLLADGVAPPLCTRRSAFVDERKYQTYFKQDWSPMDRAHIDHLIVFQDHSQNSHKLRRYRALGSLIKSHFPLSEGSACIYLKRGNSGLRRSISNEEEIVDALVSRGFIVLDIESDHLDYILQTLMKAKIVVSMEGSHIAHCIHTCPESSALLVLQPPDRFTATHRSWSSCLGIGFGFVVGTIGKGEYHFSVREILLTIDLLLDRAEIG